jgi:hypothetical protein
VSVNPLNPVPFVTFLPPPSSNQGAGLNSPFAPFGALPFPPQYGAFDFIPLAGTVVSSVTPQYPVNTVAPVVSGSTVEPATLTTTNGTWTNTPTGYAYQWYSGGFAVGTNANTYTTVAGDVGNLIYCVVTATNTHGSRLANSNTVGPITSAGGTAELDFSQASNSMYGDLVLWI